MRLYSQRLAMATAPHEAPEHAEVHRMNVESGISATRGLWTVRGGVIFRGGGRVDHNDRSLSVRSGHVVSQVSSTDTIEIPDDWIVLPGFIEPHIHGAVGADVMDDADGALDTLAAHLPREGVTSFLELIRK